MFPFPFRILLLPGLGSLRETSVSPFCLESPVTVGDCCAWISRSNWSSILAKSEAFCCTAPPGDWDWFAEVCSAEDIGVDGFDREGVFAEGLAEPFGGCDDLSDSCSAPIGLDGRFSVPPSAGTGLLAANEAKSLDRALSASSACSSCSRAVAADGRVKRCATLPLASGFDWVHSAFFASCDLSNKLFSAVFTIPFSVSRIAFDCSSN